MRKKVLINEERNHSMTATYLLRTFKSIGNYILMICFGITSYPLSAILLSMWK